MATNEGFTTGACEQYEALLEDYMNGDLGAADARSAADHWQNCPGCRSALQKAAAGARLLRAAEPSLDPGTGFARMVMARIRTAENESAAMRLSFWQPFVSFGWRFAATATLALVALVTYNAGWGHPAQPNVAAARPTIASDIFAPEPARVPANGDEVLMMVADNGHGKY